MAPRGQVAVEPAGTVERRGQPDAAVLEPVSVAIGIGVHAALLVGQARQSAKVGAVSRRGEQFPVGSIPGRLRQKVRPCRELAGHRLGDRARRQGLR